MGVRSVAWGVELPAAVGEVECCTSRTLALDMMSEGLESILGFFFQSRLSRVPATVVRLFLPACGFQFGELFREVKEPLEHRYLFGEREELLEDRDFFGEREELLEDRELAPVTTVLPLFLPGCSSHLELSENRDLFGEHEEELEDRDLFGERDEQLEVEEREELL